jgi:hypothetical protein
MKKKLFVTITILCIAVTAWWIYATGGSASLKDQKEVNLSFIVDELLACKDKISAERLLQRKGFSVSEKLGNVSLFTNIPSISLPKAYILCYTIDENAQP